MSQSRLRTAIHALAVVAYLPDGSATSERVAGSVSGDPSSARRVLSRLRKAGLLTAAEGRNGGYTLARPASQIRLDEIYAAVLDAPLFPMPERRANPTCPVGSRIHAVLDGPLGAAEDAARGALHTSTLADVLHELLR